jgi:NAD(P)H-dependent FMN reductase
MTDRQRRRPAAVVTGGGGGIGTAALAVALEPALARCGMTAVGAAGQSAGFAAGFAAAEEAVQRAGGLDAIVIAPGSFASGPGVPSWAEMLAGYASTTDRVLAHAAWLRAAAREAVRTSRPLRVVHLADATSPPLYPAAQAVAQFARCAGLLRPDLIDAFSIALEPVLDRAVLGPDLCEQSSSRGSNRYTTTLRYLSTCRARSIKVVSHS